MYHGADQSWREKPRFMSDDTIQNFSRELAAHVNRHQIQEVDLAFHGGEPLLFGVEKFRYLIDTVEKQVKCKINWGMQTNAILISKEYLDFFDSRNVTFGISLDGNKSANDIHRLYKNGKSSFDKVMNAIALIRSERRWSRLLSGALIVIDLRNDPAEILSFFRNLGFSNIDILLPDSHHDSPPPCPATQSSESSYGNWLQRFFDIWLNEYPEFEVRYLAEIMTQILGGESQLEALGAKSANLMVVETDGAIEPVDTLKVIGRFATDISLNVYENTFEDALAHPAFRSRMSGFDTLCEECKACPEINNCGGGYLPHRYSSTKGFDNPSVYCSDLKHIFHTIRLRMVDEFARASAG